MRLTHEAPVCAGSVLAIAHGRSMARVTAPAVLGESALLAALAKISGSRPLTYRHGFGTCTHCCAVREQANW